MSVARVKVWIAGDILTASDLNTEFDAAMGTQMANPMTTAGDTIYGGTDGEATRLAKGTATQLLAMNSGATAPEWITGSGTYVLKSLYDANTILYATTDNTPATLTVAQQTVVGRITSGAIASLTVAQLQTLLLSSSFPENVALLLPSSLTLDGKYIAIKSEAGTLGETVVFGECIYLKASDGKWWKAKADATATSGVVRVGYCCIAGNADAATVIMFKGIIRADTLFDTFTISAPVFLSAATAGKIVSAAPSGTTNFVIRIAGHAGPDGNTVHVNISPDYLELA